MKTKKSLAAVFTLFLLNINLSFAQIGKNLFDIPIDTSVTYDEIIAKYGEPKEISGKESSLRSLNYYLNVPDDYMYGWMMIRVNAQNKFCGYNLKVEHQFDPTKRTLDAFKLKFNLSEDLVNLFYFNEKEFKAKLSSNGYAVTKRADGLDYIKEFDLKTSDPLINGITISVGEGKLFEKSKNELWNRQNKLYQLDVYYANAFK